MPFTPSTPAEPPTFGGESEAKIPGPTSRGNGESGLDPSNLAPSDRHAAGFHRRTPTTVFERPSDLSKLPR